MKRKLVAIFFCRRESPMCNQIIKTLMMLDTEFKILQMPLSNIFLIESEMGTKEMIQSIRDNGVKTMSLVFDVSHGMDFELSYLLPDNHADEIDAFVYKGMDSFREEVEDTLRSEGDYPRSGMPKKKEGSTSSVQYDQMTADEILDLAAERGGIDKLPVEAKTRLDQLSKE